MRAGIAKALRVIDRISGIFGAFAVLCLAVLIGAMVVEVFARHVLGRPT